MEKEKAVQVDSITYLIRGDKVRLLEQWLKDNCCGAAAVGTYDGYMREVDEARKYFEEFPAAEEEKKEVRRMQNCRHRRTGYVSTLAGRRCLDCWEAVGDGPHGVITYDEKDVMRIVNENECLRKACWDALALNENPRRDGKDEEEWQDTMRNIRAALNPGCRGLPPEPER